uniref:Cytochrome b6/f complex subunit VI n=1 Tax=Cyperus fuscus TaxID=529431 RepID=A0A6H0EYX1_9POAL|nr:cytochrome b6/f complex subunit VI [Cyperus fuscus]
MLTITSDFSCVLAASTITLVLLIGVRMIRLM